MTTPRGSTCQLACVDENLIAKIPAELSFTDAASLPLVGMTVIQAMRPHVSSLLRSDPSERRGTALIQGGAGGVGTFAIQYCVHHLQLEVYTTCSPSNAELVRSLGASQVIDYHHVDWREFKNRFDVILDTKAYIYEDITFKYQLLKEDVRHTPHI